jgi:hypothetical protein
MTLKNENASQTESPSLISEILTKEPGLMRPARPNKSWAEDLPRSPFLLSFTARLRKAADGSSPRPCQEGKVVAVVQGLTHFLPRTSRDWRAGKCLSGLRWRRLPVGHLPCELVLVFSPVPHYVDHQNVNSFTLCYGRTQLLLWKVGA